MFGVGDWVTAGTFWEICKGIIGMHGLQWGPYLEAPSWSCSARWINKPLTYSVDS